VESSTLNRIYGEKNDYDNDSDNNKNNCVGEKEKLLSWGWLFRRNIIYIYINYFFLE